MQSKVKRCETILSEALKIINKNKKENIKHDEIISGNITKLAVNNFMIEHMKNDM